MVRTNQPLGDGQAAHKRRTALTTPISTGAPPVTVTGECTTGVSHAHDGSAIPPVGACSVIEQTDPTRSWAGTGKTPPVAPVTDHRPAAAGSWPCTQE